VGIWHPRGREGATIFNLRGVIFSIFKRAAFSEKGLSGGIGTAFRGGEKKKFWRIHRGVGRSGQLYLYRGTFKRRHRGGGGEGAHGPGHTLELLKEKRFQDVEKRDEICF